MELLTDPDVVFFEMVEMPQRLDRGVVPQCDAAQRFAGAHDDDRPQIAGTAGIKRGQPYVFGSRRGRCRRGRLFRWRIRDPRFAFLRVGGDFRYGGSIGFPVIRRDGGTVLFFGVAVADRPGGSERGIVLDRRRIGIGIAAGIMVGNELGAGRLETGKAYGIRLMRISYLIGVISAGLVLLSIPVAVRMVQLTPEARSYLTSMMLLLSFYMIGRCVNTVTINGVLDGGGDTLFDLYSLVVTMWLLAIPLAWLGAFRFGWQPLLVYACTCLDEVGKIPWVMVRFRKYKWVKDLTRVR